jgi:hypothetical protein
MWDRIKDKPRQLSNKNKNFNFASHYAEKNEMLVFNLLGINILI